MDTPRERIKETYEEAADQIRNLAETTTRSSQEALSYTDQWVHENPWLALAVVGGAGLLLGLLVSQTLRES